MRMSNYLGVGGENRGVMAATQSGFGIQHLTVVPRNFEPEVDDATEESEPEDEAASDARR